jgi:predicted nuclease of predicted toxin-antitoxin system
VMSKDRDLADLVLRHGPPPQIIWITCGNTSNRRLEEILSGPGQRSSDCCRQARS